MILVGMYIQQNSRNLVSNNPEISIIRRLRWIVPRLEIVLFTRKKLQHWNRDAFKKALRNVYANHCNITRPSFPAPMSSAMKTPENTEEDSDDPESADEGDKYVQYFSV